MSSCKKIFCFLFVYLFFLFNFLKAVDFTDIYSVKWRPDGNYVAIAGSAGATYQEIQIYSFDKSTNQVSDTPVAHADYGGSTVYNVDWSPDGNYLAVGGSKIDGTSFGDGEFKIYSFDGSNLIFKADQWFSGAASEEHVYKVAWHPLSNYIAVITDLADQPEFAIFYYDTTTSNTPKTDTKDYTNDSALRAVAWHPDGNYIAVGGSTISAATDDVYTYSFDYINGGKLSINNIDSIDYGFRVYDLKFSNNGKYLALAGNAPNSGNELQIYSFDGGYVSPIPIDSKNYDSGFLRSLSWSYDDNYLAVSGDLDDLRIYSFDSRIGKLSDLPLLELNFTDFVTEVNFSKDGRYLAMGGLSNVFTTSWSYYKGLGLIRYDGTEYGVYKDIHTVLHNGDNAKGRVVFEQGFTILKGEGARLDIDFPANGVIDLRNTGTLDLGGDLILDSSVTLSSGGVICGGGNTIFLNGNLEVPDNSSIKFIDDTVINGQGNDFILGHRAYFFIDNNVTLTLKNLTLKSYGANSITPYPIQVNGIQSRIALDNITFALNGNITFTKGSLFIHNDVSFTGTTEFIYSSPQATYIAPKGCLAFDPQTSFFYNQDGVSSNMNLIVMQDETSDLYLDGATLRTTDTGLRLTVGRLFLNNKVTLSCYSKVPQTFSNSLIFGNSSLGSDYDLDVYLLSAGRVNIWGKVWHDSLNSFDFANKDSYITLNTDNSGFKLTNADSVSGWKETAIVRALSESTLFLSDNQEWGVSSGTNSPPQETFELINDFKIPDNQTIYITEDMVIDGKGNDLILGHRSQFLIDGDVTFTLKNLVLKNRMNTFFKPPIECISWHSKLCLDNVTFCLNDDFVFRNGQMFIHNDVEFTGTSKFIYRSPSPSYIAPHSNLIFDSRTTFEFHPNSENNNLIKMQDKASSIIFDGATLQTTNTGIRLTKGSLYFDNRVTLSSNVENTLLDSQTSVPYKYYTGLREALAIDWRSDGKYVGFGYGYWGYGVSAYYNVTSSLNWMHKISDIDGQVFSVKWSPRGEYIAIGIQGGALKIFSYSADSYDSTIFSRDLGTDINSVSWAPNGKYLCWGDASGNLRIDSFSDLQTNPSTPDYVLNNDMGAEIHAASWDPTGEYIALGQTDGYLQLYEFSEILENPTSPSYTFSQDLGSSINLNTLNWSPDGKYLAWVDSPGNLRIISMSELQNNKTTPDYLFNRDLNAYCVAWSPDGAYVATGDSAGDVKGYSFQELKGNPVSPGVIFTQNVEQDGSGYDEVINAVSWSPDGERIATAGGSSSVSSIIGIVDLNYRLDVTPQAYSNSIIFGDSSLGSNYNLDVHLLSAARMEIWGKVWDDGV